MPLIIGRGFADMKILKKKKKKKKIRKKKKKQQKKQKQSEADLISITMWNMEYFDKI